MNVICVDDEESVLQNTVMMCRQLPDVDEVVGFTTAESALAWMEKHTAALAMLDIHLPGMDGLALAKRIRERSPNTGIVFVTAFSQYALEALSVHADGYLIKPVTYEKISREAAYVFKYRYRQNPEHIYVQTFGNFDLFVDGEMAAFHRAKAKEILAYLVDRHGSSVTRAEVFAILYGDREYTLPMQKQLDVMIRSLRGTLREYGVSEILEMRSGVLRIRPDRFSCDLYRYMQGDREAINAYRGVYMSTYSWASLTEALVTSRKSTFQ